MAGEQLRILVDDEETIRILLQQALEEAGYDVVTVADGQEALDKMFQQKTEALLVDIKMQGMSGIGVLQQLATERPEATVVIVTALSDVQSAVDAMKLGAYDCIAKPFNPGHVVLTVQRAITKRHLQLEHERHQLELEKRVREQAEQLQQQFVDLVESLARGHNLLRELAERQQRGATSFFKRLLPEWQEPMSSVEEFSGALLRILRKGRV